MPREKAPEFHIDKIGQEVRPGNYVTACYSGRYSASLELARVVKITPKKIYLVGLKDKNEWSVWSTEVVKLTGEDMLAFLLKYE